MTEVTGSNLRHARPGAGRALVGNGETGRAQSQWNQPVTGTATGGRIGGYDYKTESFQRPCAEQHARFREIQNFKFFANRGIRVFVLPRTAVVAVPGSAWGEQPDEKEERKHHDQLDEHDDHRPRPDHESQESYEK